MSAGQDIKLLNIFPAFFKKIADMLHVSEKSIEGVHDLIASSQKAANSVISGWHKQKKAGTGENFWQFREYDSQDRPQDIDWRQSAKGDHIYIKQKELQSAQNIYFWCNMSPSMGFASNGQIRKDENASVMAISLSMLLVNSGEMVSILGENMRAGKTQAKIEKMAQILFNKIRNGKNTDLSQLHGFKVPANSTLVLVSDFLDDIDDIEKSFRSLSKLYKSCFIIQILDDAEIDFPYKGRVVFTDPVSGEKENIEKADAIADEYRKRISNHCSRLEHLCANLGWEYYMHKGSRAIDDSLSDIYNIWSLKSKS